MSRKLLASGMCLALLLLTANCRINRRTEMLAKHASNADEAGSKLHANVHELRVSINQLMEEFRAGSATDVPSKVSKLEMQAEKLDEQSEDLKSQLRELAAEMARRSDGE
jgi:uncharacterized protein YukE